MRTIMTCGAAAAAMLLLSVAASPAQSNEYLDFAALTSELQALAASSDSAELQSIGTSRDGHDIWLMQVGDSSGAPMEERSAVLVVANLEGDHVVGSHLAVEMIRYLLNDPAAADVLAEQVVYVIPRLNPDGAEAMFSAVKYDRKVNGFPYDADNDGRADEDPGEDLNGDGMITLMRVPDPGGRFMVHPDDARLMKRADRSAGETGAYMLYTEGVDTDGDGFYNEDGAGGVDLNRNFQHEHPYYEPDAGLYMVSEPESRALMDFVVAHGNIGAVLTFGHSDNLVTPPNARGELAAPSTFDLEAFAAEPNEGVYEVGVFGGGGGGGRGGFGFGGAVGAGGVELRGAQPGRDNDPQSGRRPAVTVDGDDIVYYEAVSDAYREITGIEEVGINRAAEGAFFQVGYFQRGIPSFSTQGWGLPETEAEGDSADARVLAAMDAAGVDAFVDWTSFEHPELGTVEIGGFVPYAATNPPVAQAADLGRAHGEFLVRLAGMLPRVSIVDTEVTAHGGGIFTVSASVENTGYLPTSLEHGIVSGAVQPTLVRIQVDPEAILTGDDKTESIDKLEGSGARERFSWVIRASEGQQVEIWVRSHKGGTATATVTLQ